MMFKTIPHEEVMKKSKALRKRNKALKEAARLLQGYTHTEDEGTLCHALENATLDADGLHIYLSIPL